MAVIKTEKLICDVCGKEITDSSGRLDFEFDVKDYLGNNCNKVRINFNDICYDCVLKMDAAINGKHVEIKKENKYVND